jgi:hypothetical protein
MKLFCHSLVREAATEAVKANLRTKMHIDHVGVHILALGARLPANAVGARP